MNDQNPPPSDTPPVCEGEGVSRRRLIRAGLSAAPVMAALKSNSVLAGDYNCIKPSTFSSLAPVGMKVSQGRTIRADYQCKSPGYWTKHLGNLADYGNGKNFKTETPFISTTTGFTVNPGNAFSGKSLQAVLEMDGNDSKVVALARHVVAAFLTAVSNGDDPETVILTKSDCRKIWEGQGVWSPFAGTTWTLNQTMAYFDEVYG